MVMKHRAKKPASGPHYSTKTKKRLKTLAVLRKLKMVKTQTFKEAWNTAIKRDE